MNTSKITPSVKEKTALHSSSFSPETFDKLNFVLDETQIDVLRKMRDNLELHRETAQIFRSEVEMRFSVLNDVKFPTPDAKYWQAVREQDVHCSNLVQLTYEFELEIIKIKNLEDMIHRHQIKQKKLERDVLTNSSVEDPLDIEEAQIEHSMLQNKIDTLLVEIRRCKYMQDERRRVANNRWREVVTWEMLCTELKPKMKYGIISYEHHQPESYGLRMARQEKIMLKSGAKGSPSEAINITSQNRMIKKLIEEGTLQPDPRELPINKAARKVVEMLDEGKNYINQKTEILPTQPQPQLKQNISSKVTSNEEVDAMLSNPQIPK